jgi:hypothetical protein
MRLAKEGDPKGATFYRLGSGGQYYHRWAAASKGQQDEWRGLIIAAAGAVRHIVGSCDC